MKYKVGDRVVTGENHPYFKDQSNKECVIAWVGYIGAMLQHGDCDIDHRWFNDDNWRLFFDNECFTPKPTSE